MKSVLLVLALAGCNDGPAAAGLVGKWTTAVSSGGVTFNETFDLQAGGTATLTLTGTGSCHGTETYTGGSWSSAATTLTLSGNPACSGGLTCTIMGTVVNIGCSSAPSSGTVPYTLDNNTLTLTQTNDAGSMSTLTLTRG
jgi:hypothetical protein